MKSLRTALALALALATPVVASQSNAAAIDVLAVPASAETAPVFHAGDAADDPAIWVHPDDPSKSLIIGNDKAPGADDGEIDTWDLEGHLVQRISTPRGFWGNVDVRQGVEIAGAPTDIVVVPRDGVQVYTVDPATRMLRPILEGSIAAWGEGVCLYDSHSTGEVYAFVVGISGLVRQVELVDADHDGLLEGHRVRSFEVGSEAEGCVVDDQAQALYLSEEEVGIWKYGAEPDAGTSRTMVDRVVADGGHLTPDVEGLTLVDQVGGAGYLIASAQSSGNPSGSSFAVYDRGGSNAYVKSFRVTAGAAADGCDGTDGIAAYGGALGPDYPSGLFVCQDNTNQAPGTTGNQDFKLVDLGAVFAPPSRPGTHRVVPAVD